MNSLCCDQEAIENVFNRKNIRIKVEEDILSTPIMVKKLEESIKIIREHSESTFKYPSKNRRMELLKSMNHEKIAMDIFVAVLKYGRTQLFTSVVGQIQKKLNYEKIVDGLKTAAELIALCSDTDLYDIVPARNNDSGMMQVIPLFLLDEETEEFIRDTMYLPPMVCEPCILTTNTSSGYRTIEDDSLILGGKINHHDGNICLDSLNKFNQISLELDLQVLTGMREPRLTKEKFEARQLKNNKVFMEHEFIKARELAEQQRNVSYQIYQEIVKLGNKFYLTHKGDKRGRTYSQGYHVHTQSSDYKKAIISFSEKEVIEF